jgi:hypothetical protein
MFVAGVIDRSLAALLATHRVSSSSSSFVQLAENNSQQMTLRNSRERSGALTRARCSCGGEQTPGKPGRENVVGIVCVWTMRTMPPSNLVKGDCIPMIQAFKKRMQEKGLEFPLPQGPLPVLCEPSEMTHTVAFPICGDPTCICGPLEDARVRAEYEASKKKPRRSRPASRTLVSKSYEAQKLSVIGDALNGNRGFQVER